MKSYNKIFFLTIPIIAYLIFIFLYDAENIIKNIFNVKIENYLIFIGFWSLGVVTRIFRWHIFMKNIKPEIPFRKNILYFLSGFAMLLSPGRMGEVIRSPIIKRDYGVSISKTSSIVFVERFYDLLAVITFIAIVLPFTKINLLVLIFPLSIISIMILLIINKKLLIKFTKRLETVRFLQKMIPNVEESFETIFSLIKLRFFVIGMITTLSVVVFETLAVSSLLSSMGINLNFQDVGVIFHTSNFIASISFIPAGFGVLEGSLSGLLMLYNVSSNLALTVPVLIRPVATGLFTIIGVVCLKIILKTPKNVE